MLPRTRKPTLKKARKSSTRAGRTKDTYEWTVIYKKSRRRVPRAKIYGLGSLAKEQAMAAAKAHNAKR